MECHWAWNISANDIFIKKDVIGDKISIQTEYM